MRRGRPKALNREDQLIYNEIISFIKFHFQYKSEDVMHPLIKKNIRKLATGYSYKTILETFKTCKPKIEWAFENKIFTYDINRVQYIFAIINNDIFNIDKKLKLEEIQNQKQHSVEIDVFENDNVRSNISKKNMQDLLEGDV